MKDITFVVPCYNAEDYMKRCLDSLLFCGEDGEILLLTMVLPTIRGRLPMNMRRSIPIL